MCDKFVYICECDQIRLKVNQIDFNYNPHEARENSKTSKNVLYGPTDVKRVRFVK